MSEQHWRNGQATDYGVEVYTQGDCWILAWRLHVDYGYRIYSVNDGAHFVVRVGNKYLDVTGLNTRRKLLDAWECDAKNCGCVESLVLEGVHGLEIMDAAEVVAMGSLYDSSFERSKIMAKRLVETYVDQA